MALQDDFKKYGIDLVKMGNQYLINEQGSQGIGTRVGQISSSDAQNFINQGVSAVNVNNRPTGEFYNVDTNQPFNLSNASGQVNLSNLVSKYQDTEASNALMNKQVDDAKKAGGYGQVTVGDQNTIPNLQTAAQNKLGNASVPAGSQLSQNMQVGSNGAQVSALQKLLGGVAPDGIFGSKTQAAVKAFQAAHGLVADGIVGPKTLAALNGAPPALPNASAIGNGVPSGSSNGLSLPSQNTAQTNSTYYQGLTGQVANLQSQLDTMRQTQIEQINKNKEQAQTSFDTANTNENSAIATEQKAKLDQINLEEQRFNENYNIVQGLVSQLTDLMTRGNALIEQQKGVTGLASIRDPRITQTINSVTAAVGVIQAGISVYNGQMSAAREQLSTATSAITSAYADQINYYDSLRQFYGTGVVTATKEQQDFVNTSVDLLQKKIDTVQATSELIKKAMIDPDTALAYASSGVTLQDSPEQINAKLATYAYSKELSLQSKDMADKGYTALISGKPPAGAEVVTQTDSLGHTKTYYKKAAAKAAIQTWSAPYALNGVQVQKNNTTGEIRSVSGTNNSATDLKQIINQAIAASGKSYDGASDADKASYIRSLGGTPSDYGVAD